MLPPSHSEPTAAPAVFFVRIPSRSARRARGLLTAVLTAAGLFSGGCSTATPARRLELFVRTAPAPTLVAAGRELDAAEAHAAGDRACFALLGAGRSMEPLYAGGTAIVVREQSFLTLQPGFAVVYRSARGHCVAHLLLEETRRGWVAIGLNNPEPDAELVTRRNFIGVIQAAYASSDTSFRAGVAARIALRDGIDRGARTASLR